MSYDAINLINILHAQLYKSHYYLVNRYTFSQKRVPRSFKMYFMRVAKHACLIYTNTCNAGKVTTKHPCEFVLTRAVKLLHVIPLRLNKLWTITLNTKKRPIINSISTKAQLYNKETRAMRQLVKIGFPCHTLTVRPGSGLYVHCDTKSHTFGHETVRPLRRLSGRTSFSLHYPPILRLLKPTKAS
jgi:hypothetical protein